ncbi:hypothetical protein [Rhodococcus sp. NPDC058514]|uniref:hypothetical protein n=1 Tax=unclassified Rhodococcus (in: high G+C Gram-positive bacteria) TaxID=192944 RepID=UPI0036503B22
MSSKEPMSPREPEGDGQRSPFPPPFKWSAPQPTQKPTQRLPGQPRPAAVRTQSPPDVPRPDAPQPPDVPRWTAPPSPPAPKPSQPAPPSPPPTPAAAATPTAAPATPPPDSEFGAPPVSPPWLAPEPTAVRGQQVRRGRQSVAPAVLIGLLVLAIVGIVAVVVL